jgi:exosome complex RNA-binding protein Rrp4
VFNQILAAHGYGDLLMAQIVGYDDTAKSRVTCKSSRYRVGCGAIVEYTRNDVKCYRGTDYSGGSDGRDYLLCPGCSEEITLRSW